ncbi:patatin-like phospholipase family protein [Paraglaciecola mesophila]|uniref:Patatin-like phospholipase family protein n=1 Tax=Paraglaciecola mesophila TaxID=197222 RepID=A0ABU9SX12_9ALTE
MTYKVAIAISGAVSLGSYEAGTMYEIINAIKLHNESNPSDQRIKIDVMTGASAGGMTAALIAQKLLYESNSLTGALTNVGYLAWVKKVHIDGLLTTHDNDNENTSILSSGFVDSIARNLILGRYESTSIPSKVPHPASATTIKLGLALSNLNGVDYARDIFTATHDGLTGDKFIETRHQDRLTLTLGENDDNQNTWQKIADTSRACGAFPFAFSPVALFRRFEESDYQGRGAEDFSAVKPDGKFTYIDGGAFNNYPLGMARELAKSNDKDPLDYAKRFYFYISPSSKTSTMDLTTDADSPAFKMMDVAKSAAKGIFAQSRFQDWMMTDKINHKVKLLDERAKQIVDIVTSSTKTAVKRLAQTSKELCTEIYKDTTANDEQLDDAIERLTLQYKEDFADYVNATQEEKDAWIYSIALLEKSAGLNDFDIMNVYTITAKPEDLASEKVMSFMGFFEERFRHHDYMRGRLNATNVILHILESRQDSKKAKDHLPLNIDSAFYRAQKKELEDILIDPKLGNVTPKNAARAARERLYERVKDRYYAIAKQMGMNWLLRVGLYNLYIKKRLKGYFEL